MPGLHKFEKNVLELSETDDVSKLNEEWVMVGSDNKKNDPIRCACNRWITDVYYFFNVKTNHTIALGSTCMKKLAITGEGNGRMRVIDFRDFNLPIGIYTEITDMAAYSAEIRRELCALLRVEIGRCGVPSLNMLLRDPLQLLNDAGLIAYAKERLGILIKKGDEAAERYRRLQQERQLERERVEFAERQRIEALRRRDEAAEKVRIEALRRDEEDDEIAQMKFRWDWRDRVIQTEEELLLKEEFQDAERSKAHFKTWGRVLKSLELIEEQQLAKIALEKQLEEEKESRERYIRDGAERAKAAQIVFARQLQESREKHAREEAKRRESTEKFKTLMKKLKK
jgi:hypothetical protein